MDEELTPNVESNVDTDTFLQESQAKLAGAAQIVSSVDEDTLKGFDTAISTTRQAGQAAGQRLESEFGREIGYTRQAGERALGTAVESERGFATSRAAMMRLDNEIEKSVKDLEQRKQEALLSNDAATAQRVTDLQIQKLEYQDRKKQQYFDNLIQSTSMSLNVAQMQQNMRQFQIQTQQQERRLSMEEYQFALSQPMPSFDELSQMSDEEMRENFIAFRMGERAGFTTEQIKQNMLAAAQMQDLDMEQASLQRQLLRAQIQETYASMKDYDTNDPPTLEGYYSYEKQLEVSERIRQLRDTGTTDPALMYKDLRQLFGPNEVSDEALQRTLGVVTPGAEDIQQMNQQANGERPASVKGGAANFFSTLGALAIYPSYGPITNRSLGETKADIAAGAGMASRGIGGAIAYPFKQ
jgi:hypothetical protein